LPIGCIGHGFVWCAVDKTGDAVFELQCNFKRHGGTPALLVQGTIGQTTQFLDMVDVDDLMDIVVLQDDILAQDLRVLSREVDHIT
jgi:hypothetical protein